MDNRKAVYDQEIVQLGLQKAELEQEVCHMRGELKVLNDRKLKMIKEIEQFKTLIN